MGESTQTATGPVSFVRTFTRYQWMAFLVVWLGWAVGGFVFGIIADYMGRIRTLALSLAIVAVFTGLQGFAQSVPMFGVLRFLTGVGTGAEIVVGIPLVAEVFADTARAKVLAA
jgi:MFS family permease